MKASWYALPLSLALAAAGPFAACSSDDDDDNGRTEAGSGGSSQGAGGTAQGAGGAGGGSGTGGAGGAGGAPQGGGGACGTEEAEVAAAPAVVQTVVTEAKSKPETSPQGDIKRYDYNGAVVYYVPPPQMTADVKSQLYSKDGTLICEPDGGAVPVPDPKCPDFPTVQADPQSNPCVVWTNPRKPKLSQRGRRLSAGDLNAPPSPRR